MKKVRDLNKNRAKEAAEGLWILAVDQADSNGVNFVCGYISPAAFAVWLRRHREGDKTARTEAIEAIAASIEREQNQRS